MTEGTFEIEVTVEYPDGTSEDTTVQVVVTDNFLVVTKNPPKQIDGQRVAENTNVITANLTFTVEGVHDEGLNSGLSIDENGNLLKKGKHHLWGSRLFDQAQTAQNRRNYRSSRRRYNKRRQRIFWFIRNFRQCY